MVHPSGRKTYYFLYRYKSPKKQRIKVGIHGNITCEIAREIVRGWAGDLARGIDPKKHSKKQKAEEKKSIKFSQFFCLFTEKYRIIHHAKSTLNRDEYRIKLYILPFFGQNTLNEITVRDILNFKDFLKHIPGTFNKCFTLLHKAFALAELWGYREKNSNPCHGVQKYPERKMVRFLKKDELRRLEEIIKLEETYSVKSPYVLAAIRMLLYTGCRMGEILS
jgi:integrase